MDTIIFKSNFFKYNTLFEKLILNPMLMKKIRIDTIQICKTPDES